MSRNSQSNRYTSARGPMCGGFVCSKNALIALNTVYVLVGILLISVGAYAQSAAIVTSVGVIAGIITVGAFLICVAMLGLHAARTHHQVILFFYMIILFCIFVIQFSIAIACLAMSEIQVGTLVDNGWKQLQHNGMNATLFDAEHNFNCCGLNGADGTGVGCDRLECGHACEPCRELLAQKGYYGAQSAGGVGLFFSFTEILGIWLAMRYRNQKDPLTDPGAMFR